MDIKRPVNLDITTIKFPLAAIASILHRITGVILFLGTKRLVVSVTAILNFRNGFCQCNRVI